MKIEKHGTGIDAEPQFFIEKTLPDYSYSVVWRGNSFDAALERLKTIESDLRHEVWCYEWVNTGFGASPMAAIN